MSKLIRAAIIASAAVAAAGCGATWSNSHSHNTPVGGYASYPSTVIELPYGWQNIAFTCYGHNGIYEVLDTSRAITVITGDPACK